MANVLVGHFLSNTVTGDQDVLGIGFEPKAVIFFNANDAAGVNFLTNEGAAFRGIADTGLEYASGILKAQTSVTTVQASRYIGFVNAAIQSWTVPSPVPVVQSHQASLVTFLPDGFRINWSLTSVTPMAVGYMVFGQDFSVQASSLILPNAGPTSMTGLPFMPTAAFSPGTEISLTGNSQTDAFAMAFLDATTLMGNAVAITQNRDGAGRKIQSETTYPAFINTSAGVAQYDIQLDSINADGFTVSDAGGSSGPPPAVPAPFLMFGNIPAVVGAFNSRTTLGTLVISGLPFQPSCLMFSSVGPNTGGAAITTCQTSFGVCDAALNQRSVSQYVFQTSNPARPSAFFSTTDAFVQTFSTSAGTRSNTHVANVSAINPDGFDLLFTATNATVQRGLYLAMGEPVASAAAAKRLMMMGMGA